MDSIEGVLHFNTHLQVLFLGDARNLTEAEIHDRIVGKAKKISPGVAELAGPWRKKLIHLRRGKIIQFPRGRINLQVQHIVGTARAACWSAHNIARSKSRRVNGGRVSRLSNKVPT